MSLYCTGRQDVEPSGPGSAGGPIGPGFNQPPYQGPYIPQPGPPQQNQYHPPPQHPATSYSPSPYYAATGPQNRPTGVLGLADKLSGKFMHGACFLSGFDYLNSPPLFYFSAEEAGLGLIFEPCHWSDVVMFLVLSTCGFFPFLSDPFETSVYVPC